MRGEFDAGIKTIGLVRPVVVRQGADEVQFSQTHISCVVAPFLQPCCRIRQVLRTVDNDDLSALIGNVAWIAEIRFHRLKRCNGIFWTILLRDQDFVFGCVPASCPVLVCPAKAERHVGLFVSEHVVQRTFHETLSGEPIEMIAKCIYSVILRHTDLLVANFGNPQVIESKIARKVRLIMANEKRSRAGHVCPFREPFAPPGIVFRKRMILRQIICN